MKPTNSDYKNFVKIAGQGHYPLFFSQWVSESLADKHHLTIRKASHNVQHVFNQLARHRTIEKKKTALISMDKFSREEFIRSFIKMVEHEQLKGIKSLQ